MELQEKELIEELSATNTELKRAYAEHTKLKALVDQMGSKTGLSAAEETQKKNLQKRKLAEKDKIMKILAEHR